MARSRAAKVEVVIDAEESQIYGLNLALVVLFFRYFCSSNFSLSAAF